MYVLIRGYFHLNFIAKNRGRSMFAKCAIHFLHGEQELGTGYSCDDDLWKAEMQSSLQEFPPGQSWLEARGATGERVYTGSAV
ncbi:hypothetical protein Y1Q_0012630 [Alligator mississippiensis]|uniref:Uncharacterized protein n=1 Tax=Alligator mississippiensis TaxID=8496 RepID=A0A151M8C8_ALLMI|nr:hypothetical protein Y1Q_0012630 [Alligator mississippiensis]